MGTNPLDQRVSLDCFGKRLVPEPRCSGGISWDVLSTLAIEYGELSIYKPLSRFSPRRQGLHELSLEDVLHSRKTTLSKADYYVKHLFISMLCHSLRPSKEDEHSPHPSPRSSTSDVTDTTAVFPDRARATSPTPHLPEPVTTKHHPQNEPHPGWLKRRLTSQSNNHHHHLPPHPHEVYNSQDDIEWTHEGQENSSQQNLLEVVDESGEVHKRPAKRPINVRRSLLQLTPVSCFS